MSFLCTNSVTNKNLDERFNMSSLTKKSVDITSFEKVPAGEERRIKNMKVILQKKMSKDYPAGQTS